jgi:hypothetical protein
MSGVIRQGKASLATNMIHMITSLGRFYQNNFEDDSRQDAIDILLREQNSFFKPRVSQQKNEKDSVCSDNIAKEAFLLEKFNVTMGNQVYKQGDDSSVTIAKAKQQLSKAVLKI